ncbi:MAG: GAF domain-containing protein [Acidobacteria bacterium]|nr:GAF domain-containing protein [Acidobacteriota bacterium]
MRKKRTNGKGGHESRFEAALATLRRVHGELTRENLQLREDPRRPVTADAKQQNPLEERVKLLEMKNRDLSLRLETAATSRPEGAQEDLLTNLYVAGFNLHRALEWEAVLTSMTEILLNLVGARQFAIFVLNRDGETLSQVANEHGQGPSPRSIPLGEGIMGVVAKTGIPFFDGERQEGDFRNPVACVPLKAEGALLGVIQVHSLFTQKKSLTSRDHELFTLLAETAGTALMSALLRRRFLGRANGNPLAWHELLLPVQMVADDAGPTASPPGADADETARSRP